LFDVFCQNRLSNGCGEVNQVAINLLIICFFTTAGTAQLIKFLIISHLISQLIACGLTLIGDCFLLGTVVRRLQVRAIKR